MVILFTVLTFLGHQPLTQREITVTTVVDVPPCPECPTVPAEEQTFPSMFFIEAVPVPLPDEIMPPVLDLRAFASLQNHYDRHRGDISGRMHTFTNLWSSIGQLPFTADLIHPFDAVTRWVPLQIIPRRPARWWCDFDGDDYVGYEDWMEFFRRSALGLVWGGSDDGDELRITNDELRTGAGW